MINKFQKLKKIFTQVLYCISLIIFVWLNKPQLSSIIIFNFSKYLVEHKLSIDLKVSFLNVFLMQITCIRLINFSEREKKIGYLLKMIEIGYLLNY